MHRQSKAVERIIPNVEAMWNVDPHLVETVTKAYGVWFSQANRMRDETMRFAQERFTKELDAVVQLARCTNPNEALAVQADFANKMAEDYITEGQKIVELVGEMAREISSPPKPDRGRH